MTHYKIISNETSCKTNYGVKVIKEKSFTNITDNHNDIKKLVDTCNTNKVDFDHFEDVLENFLEDYNTF